MAHYMAINKSGKNLPIFSGWPSVDKGNQIGTIYNREVFIRRMELRSISETVLGGLFRASIMPRMQMEMIFSPPMLRQ
jgi:hypothetical protein